MGARSFAWGLGTAVGARVLLRQGLSWKFAGDVRRLNAGDASGLLAACAEDFVLHFPEGEHRWSGDWRGRDGMQRFLAQFTGAGIQGEIRELAMSGPPWALTLWVRFDDHADGPDGTRLYENRAVLVLRTRWGRLVEQEDFFVDTEPIGAFERKLAALESPPAG